MATSDMTGGRTHSMDATGQKFIGQANDFVTSAQNINSAVQALMNDWWGKSPEAYNAAMSQWDRDLKRVIDDLEQLTKGLGQSSTSLTDLDNQLAGMFNGFGG